MRYYPVHKNWREIKPHLENKKVQEVLRRDFNKYTIGRWNEPFKEHETPSVWETLDWRCHRVGRQPDYWRYVCATACHWLVNFNLRLAQQVEPDRKWRIITSKRHSTVWDGKKTLFDLNFIALEVRPKEAFELAYCKELKPGKLMTVAYPKSSL